MQDSRVLYRRRFDWRSLVYPSVLLGVMYWFLAHDGVAPLRTPGFWIIAALLAASEGRYFLAGAKSPDQLDLEGDDLVVRWNRRSRELRVPLHHVRCDKSSSFATAYTLWCSGEKVLVFPNRTELQDLEGAIRKGQSYEGYIQARAPSGVSAASTGPKPDDSDDCQPDVGIVWPGTEGAQLKSGVPFRLPLPPERRREVDQGKPKPIAWLLPISILNLLYGIVIISHMGGTALGTTPQGGVFLVTEQGHFTPVSKAGWLFNLAYSWLTFTSPFLAAWAVLWKGAYKEQTPRNTRNLQQLKLLSAFGVVFVGFLTLDLFLSLYTWLHHGLN